MNLSDLVKIGTHPEQGSSLVKGTAMVRDLQTAHRRILPTNALVLPLFLALSACGGGGGGTFVASTPPPPVTPPPTQTMALDIKITPLDFQGTRPGAYDLLGRVVSSSGVPNTSSSRALAAGEASLTIAKQNDVLNFRLNAPGTLPAGGTEFLSPEIFWNPTLSDPNQIFESDSGGKWPQFLGQRLTAYRVHNDGTAEEYMSYDFKRGTSYNGASSFTYDIGLSYVAMGEWSSSVVTPEAAAQPAVQLLFVNGERTPTSGIPVSGTATYGAHALSLLSPCYYSACPGLPFTLTADFGLRTIATRIDQDYQYYTDLMGYGEPAIRGAAIIGIHVNGSAPFSNDGSFDIPLAGSVNYSATNSPMPPPSQVVAGDMNGAFFGPHAEQVGGTFVVGPPSGGVLLQDAFVGQQKPH